MSEKPARKLMVTVKLEKDSAVQVRWLSKERLPGRDVKARLAAVLLPEGEVAVDSTNVVETIIPEAKLGEGRYSVFFVGYFEVAPESADYARVKGKKGVSVDYRLVFEEKSGGAQAVPGRDYEILEKRPATLSAMG
jgi:hypothetical protein